MALTTPTTIAAAMSATDTAITPTSVTGLLAGTTAQFIRVDKEFMLIDRSYSAGDAVVPVYRRGDQGSAQVAHQILAPLVAGLLTDLPALPVASAVLEPPALRNVQTVSVDTTFSATSAPPLPTKDTTYLIDKASACAVTWPAPSAAAPEGMEITFFSMTAAAHTVTYTAGFYADTTSSDVATFAAKAGASMTIVKYKGAWGVKALANVTLG